MSFHVFVGYVHMFFGEMSVYILNILLFWSTPLIALNLFVHLCSVQFSCSVMSNSVTPWTAAHQASLSNTNSRSLLRLMSIESVMPSNHLIFCHPLLLLPSIFPSIRVFSNESVLRIRQPKYWSFSLNISPSSATWLTHNAWWLWSAQRAPSLKFAGLTVHPKHNGKLGTHLVERQLQQ